MPPHLHPRSRLTSSLFATTLLASFIIVGIPHLLPCPAPRVAYADDGPDGPPKRRRKKKICTATDGTPPPVKVDDGTEGNAATLDGLRQRKARECPVPKPPGLLGEMLGFKNSSSDGQGGRPP